MSTKDGERRAIATIPAETAHWQVSNFHFEVEVAVTQFFTLIPTNGLHVVWFRLHFSTSFEARAACHTVHARSVEVSA